jgi:hypothetical protein
LITALVCDRAELEDPTKITVSGTDPSTAGAVGDAASGRV